MISNVILLLKVLKTARSNWNQRANQIGSAIFSESVAISKEDHHEDLISENISKKEKLTSHPLKVKEMELDGKKKRRKKEWKRRRMAKNKGC